MTRNPLRVAVAQASPAPRDVARNIGHAQRLIETAEAQLLVLPELFLTGYQTVGLDELAMAHDDPRLEALVTSCRSTGTALLVGFVERSAQGPFDSMLAIDRDGTVRRPIRKTHLFGGENEVFARGDALRTTRLCDLEIGVLNCFEIEFPEVARTLALRGAELLAAASANMHPYARDHRIAATARALENRLPVAYANRVGTESGHRFCGSSRIIDADGATLAELDEAAEGVARANIVPGPRTAGDTAMLAQRRPELYAS
ncbi:hypothetical protein MUN77_09250 [Leucobacter allii]|uniref:carbon-nitrogen hydrolase family protein n=1 Tax=Leucobacter allii TaxID=2932247 RepID=UPI001FD10A76|nr:nitrilase-related carbon-nitrogen hydrolase [Leucobacter allii]UOR00362.1 hypothetical protein MUN77_09250 [Leucobacter allii]